MRRQHTAIAGFLALAAAAAVIALAGGATTARAEHAQQADHSMHMAATPTREAFAADMRQLWFEHVEWTRLAIVSFDGNLPDLKTTLARLLRNQTDIGNAIKPYYGDAAATKLTALLKQHILIAVDVLKAAKAGNAAALKRAQARWQANADQLATFLSAANPQHWPKSALVSMLRAHLALTTNEAVARLQHRWAADVQAADAVEHEMMMMADALSSGIIAQFPERFSTT